MGTGGRRWIRARYYMCSGPRRNVDWPSPYTSRRLGEFPCGCVHSRPDRELARQVHDQQSHSHACAQTHTAGGDWRGLLRDVWAWGVANVSAKCSMLLGTVRACGAALVDWRGLLSAVWAWGVALVLALLPQSLCPVQVRRQWQFAIGCAPLTVWSASVYTPCSATPCSCVCVCVCVCARARACVDMPL